MPIKPSSNVVDPVERERLLERLREVCLGLPETTERPSHGAPTWFVRGKSTFVTLWLEGHHDNAFTHLWCAAPPGCGGLSQPELW